MTFALSPHLPQGMLSNLIVADIAPSKGELSSEFRGYVEGMKKLEASKVSSRKEAQDILTEYEKVRPNQFHQGSCFQKVSNLKLIKSRRTHPSARSF